MRTPSNEMNFPGDTRESTRSPPPYNLKDSGCCTLGDAEMESVDEGPAPWKKRSSNKCQLSFRADVEARDQPPASGQQVSLAVRCSFGLLMLLTEALLIGCMALALFWMFYYHDGVSWDPETPQAFNLHYILMVAGFIFFNGHAMLVYRCCFCCKKIYQKVLHTVLFMLSTSAIIVGLIVAIRGMANEHFYSPHAWMGVAASGLFALQFLMGFIAYLVLPCWDEQTAKFRLRLLSTHVTFGLLIFSLGSATTLTGIMEIANGAVDETETTVIKTLAIAIVGLMIFLPFILMNKSFK